MWALFDFACEGKLLGTSRTFKQEYENPIVRVSSHTYLIPQWKFYSTSRKKQLMSRDLLISKIIGEILYLIILQCC